MAEEAAYRLKDAIDKHVLAQITGASGFDAVDANEMQGGTANNAVSAGSAAIIDIFSNARRVLRDNNVEEMGDWCAVVSPKVAFRIEQKSANVGYNVADSTLRNGYMGDFLGFQVFISVNLPSGKCSAIAPGNKGHGGPSAAAMSATTCRSIYFGRKGGIDLVMQRSPALEIRKCEDKLGSNFITWTVYGSVVANKNQSRGLNVAVTTATAG